jgi:TolB-like protein/class 3 adenylate cyclase/Tfp pilus assembly protein PilF
VTAERVERRLAAVLAADVAGYSRLMGADEEGTLARLKAARKAFVDPTIAAHRGRIVKTTGDGMLVEFASAVDAVRAAIEVQRAMDEQNATVPENQRLEFRIGIHVGDIIIDDNDIFGDGVNIAARLEGIAEPGGVCMSNDAYRQVRGKVEIVCEDLGPLHLKNIAEPMQAWRVRSTSQASSSAKFGSAVASPSVLPLPDKPSIAVLPFQNMSGDPEQEYFADGMVEDIITALSRFNSLFVIARNSSFTYKGKLVDIKQVGRELGVRYVLEGSVRKAGNRVRITGQLIDANNGSHIWASKFDGGLHDIFDLQDDITSSVVGAIAPKLQQSEFERSKQKPTENMSAYDYYLRGLSKMYQFKKEALEEAQPLFRKAFEFDPEFAAPYAALSFSYGVRHTYGWGLITQEEKSELIAFANRALDLDNEDASVLTQAGYMLALLGDEVERGAALIERAINANPNLGQAWTYRGLVNVLLGNPEQSIEYSKRSMRLSPLDPLAFVPKVGLAWGYLFSDQYIEAAKWAAEAVIEKPDFLSAQRCAIACHALAGNLEAAKASWEISKRTDPTQRVSQTKQRLPLRREADLMKLVEGFRLAGMPD